MDINYVYPRINRWYVQPNGSVYYAEMRQSTLWKEHFVMNGYLETKKLKIAEKDALSGTEDQKTAFFINLYNFLCMYAVCVERHMPTEVQKIENFFEQDICELRGITLSLNDILHGILRSNRPHPTLNVPVLEEDSPKLVFARKEFDPRILFVLTSVDRSCPPLPTVSVAGEFLQMILTSAVTNFLERNVRYKPREKSVILPRMFLWYRYDFDEGGEEAEVVRWIARNMPGRISTQLSTLMDEMESKGGVRIIYDEYDFRLNRYPLVYRIGCNATW